MQDSIGEPNKRAPRWKHESGERSFHVVRTGGVECGADLAATESAGIELAGWFTGYFDGFARAGHGAYKAVYDQALRA